MGVAGALQFDVIADRIRTEYDLDVRFEGTTYQTARWVSCPDRLGMKDFFESNRASMAEDHDGDPVFLARNPLAVENGGRRLAASRVIEH